jgi:flagellar motor switch protein FliG
MAVATGEEKAALLLKSLPAEVAEGLLARLQPEHSSRVRAQMQRLEQRPEPLETLDPILDEIAGMLRQPSGDSVEISAQGSGAAAYRENRPLEVPPDAAPQPEPVPPPPAPSSADPLTQLRQMNEELLAATLEGEQPGTVALVLNFLEAEQAGAVLKRLSPPLRRAVSVQLAAVAAPSRELLVRIAQALIAKSHSSKDTPTVEAGDAKFKKMANMLRLLDKEDRMEMLAAIEENNPETATRVKENLYQFEDLMVIEDRSMQKLLAEIDSRSLATAIKSAPEAIREKVLNNLSKRARDALTEEMEFLGTLPPSQVKQAQKMVVDVIQRLDQAGELVMNQ